MLKGCSAHMLWRNWTWKIPVQSPGLWYFGKPAVFQEVKPNTLRLTILAAFIQIKKFCRTARMCNSCKSLANDGRQLQVANDRKLLITSGPSQNGIKSWQCNKWIYLALSTFSAKHNWVVQYFLIVYINHRSTASLMFCPRHTRVTSH